jgi:hypothetical protein
MSASIHHLASAAKARPRGPLGDAPGRGLPTHFAGQHPAWLVDVAALAHCRAVLLGHLEQLELHALGRRAPVLAPMDVPPAYDRFCRAHFASVRRVNPGLAWEDAYPAYAIALAAHAALVSEFDEARERLLERHWDRIRGQSHLAWAQARTLIAAGCSTLDRLDPLAMNR